MIYIPKTGTKSPDVSRIGGKAFNLAKLQNSGVFVPVWFVLTVDAYKAKGLADELQKSLTSTGLLGKKLAVRSSAVEEDGARSSFAGQFKTVLGVKSEIQDMMTAITEVWESDSSLHVDAYRNLFGKQTKAPAMAVIVQELVDAEVSGVAFSMDPVTGDLNTAVIAAVLGFGDALVSGEVNAETFYVRESHVTRQASEGENLSVLSDDQAVAIATEVRKLASVFGKPQDMEWSLTGNKKKLAVLQTRPITTSVKGEHHIWDNSNIVESYSGVTTPLTFSYVRSVYEEAYRQFGKIVGISDQVLEMHRDNLANRLGFIKGRVYYNLLNWYKGLAYLPGFTVNRPFMEKMMGVSKQLENPPQMPASTGKWADVVQFFKMIVKIIFEYFVIDLRVVSFHKRVDRMLKPILEKDLTHLSADELLALYRLQEDELLKHWHAPLINDFFAMIYFGTLCALVEKWTPDLPQTVSNDLLCAEGGIISTQPAKNIMRLSKMVVSDPALKNLFDQNPVDADVWAAAKNHPLFYIGLTDYISSFGDRCMNELKLETVTFFENPAFLIKLIRLYVNQNILDPSHADKNELQARHEAEKAILMRLGFSRKRVFLWVLKNARARVRDRENLRFERTRTFGVVRRVFIALGHHFVKWNVLEKERDIFFLTKEEIFGFVETTGVTSNLKSLVELRKKEFNDNVDCPDPPDRFESYGPVIGDSPSQIGEMLSDAELAGVGCCPGVVRAKVRVVRDPLDAGDIAGHILVAEKTDPGWTLIFPACKGILVQRGSLLSHSAIVAREMGIPCIVGIPHLLASLKDGEEIEMDGTSGRIQRR